MQLSWTGRRVLVVEDNGLVALPLIAHLEDCGAAVIGPVPSMQAAFAVLARGEPIDGAVLDVDLDGTLVWPLAAALEKRGIPFVFATGSTEVSLYPDHLQQHPRFSKPYDEDAVAGTLLELIAEAAATSCLVTLP